MKVSPHNQTLILANDRARPEDRYASRRNAARAAEPSFSSPDEVTIAAADKNLPRTDSPSTALTTAWAAASPSEQRQPARPSAYLGAVEYYSRVQRGRDAPSMSTFIDVRV